MYRISHPPDLKIKGIFKWLSLGTYCIQNNQTLPKGPFCLPQPQRKKGFWGESRGTGRSSIVLGLGHSGSGANPTGTKGTQRPNEHSFLRLSKATEGSLKIVKKQAEPTKDE